MTPQEAKTLLHKYNNGICTEQEKKLLDAWFDQLNQNSPSISEDRLEQLSQEIQANLPIAEKRKNNSTTWIIGLSAAATALIALATWMHNPAQFKPQQQSVAQDIPPGGNNATLTLSNGQTIILDKNQNGIIIFKDQLTYSNGNSLKVESQYTEHTITTPKGGQYQIELPDGTKVWLNSSTKVQYATDLNIASGKRKFRLVEGEAYFEVQKDRQHPFLVSTEDQEIRVLGTAFNLSAYTDQSEIKTTLLEGSVTVSADSGSDTQILKPGEQARNYYGRLSKNKVDTDLVTAWKKGKTAFEDADLKTVMNLLERWYDIETYYEFNNTESRFTGSISRNKNISAVLRLLESTGEVHFKIEERKVTVMR